MTAPRTPGHTPARTLNVGLTGNIASGKSAVAARLGVLGAVVLDADGFAREAVAPGTAALAAVVARFGPSILKPDGALDRNALGRIVFRNDRARADLEAIIHPVVARLRSAAIDDARMRGAPIVVSDVPLLYEAGLEHDFDLVVLVCAPEAARLARLVRARGIAEPDARAMMAAQGDAEAKRSRADILVENDGTLAALERRTDEVWRELQARAAAGL